MHHTECRTMQVMIIQEKLQWGSDKNGKGNGSWIFRSLSAKKGEHENMKMKWWGTIRQWSCIMLKKIIPKRNSVLGCRMLSVNVSTNNYFINVDNTRYSHQTCWTMYKHNYTKVDIIFFTTYKSTCRYSNIVINFQRDFNNCLVWKWESHSL